MACGSIAFIFAFDILRKVAQSGPNTEEGGRDLGLWSSASSQSALQCVRHASAYLMLLCLGCCTAFCHLLSFRGWQASSPELNHSS